MPILTGSSLNLLAVNPGLVIWTVVTFTLVLLVLWKYAWAPIVQAVDARNDKIEDDLKSSEQLRKEAEALLKGYESKLDAAKKEVADLLDEARKDAEITRNKIIEDSRNEATQIKQRATHDIEQARIKAVKEIQEQAVEISLQLLKNVLRNVPEAEHKKLIVEELGRLKGNN